MSNNRRDRSDSWASPPLPPPELVVVVDDFSGADAVPAAERSWLGRIHPLQGATLSLVGGGSPGPLSTHRRDLKSPLPPLLFDPPVPPPPPLPHM